MGRFNQADFNAFILKERVIGLFDKPVTLKSGRQSNWYVNWRTVSEDVYRLDVLTDFAINFVLDLVASGELGREPQCIYGVPEGATKYGLLAQYKWAKRAAHFGPGSHALAMGRGKPKEHGVPKDKFFVGEPRGLTLVLEDVTTTGGSLLTTIDQLLEAGVEICAAVGLTNRMEKRDDGLSVEAAVQKKISAGQPIPYFHMSRATELLPLVLDEMKPAKAIFEAIAAEFIEYGVEPLAIKL